MNFTEKEDVLKQCWVEGSIVKLPNHQLDRKVYLDVKNALELIGGKWKGGKIAGFVFPNDPTELLQQIANGEKRNLKKEYQFFATPDELADKLVEMAELGSPGEYLKITDSHKILEPSAGQGAIIKAIRRFHQSNTIVFVFELMEANRMILKKIPDISLNKNPDFLEYQNKPPYDIYFERIIANPPFTKNQDIDHIRKMYDLLKPGGILVSMASTHWQLSTNKKETEFRNWLEEIGAMIESVPEGTFKISGTNIKTLILKIIKPLNVEN